MKWPVIHKPVVSLRKTTFEVDTAASRAFLPESTARPLLYVKLTLAVFLTR